MDAQARLEGREHPDPSVVPQNEVEQLENGHELGQFGFGSTVVAIVAAGGPTFAHPAPEARVLMGAAATPES